MLQNHVTQSSKALAPRRGGNPKESGVLFAKAIIKKVGDAESNSWTIKADVVHNKSGIICTIECPFCPATALRLLMRAPKDLPKEATELIASAFQGLAEHIMDEHT